MYSDNIHGSVAVAELVLSSPKIWLNEGFVKLPFVRYPELLSRAVGVRLWIGQRPEPWEVKFRKDRPLRFERPGSEPDWRP
jgi:hypothetical protein